jgi:hypothetical protein
MPQVVDVAEHILSEETGSHSEKDRIVIIILQGNLLLWQIFFYYLENCRENWRISSQA